MDVSQLDLEFPKQLNIWLFSATQLLEFADEVKCILGERKSKLPEFPLRKMIKMQLCARGIYLSHVE